MMTYTTTCSFGNPNFVSRLYQVIALPDGRKTEFRFSRFNGHGFSDEQIKYIVELMEIYLKRYKKLVIKKVTDFYYYHNQFYCDNKGKKYSDISIWAEYLYDEHIIGLNHILMSEMPLENKKFIKKIGEVTKDAGDILEQINDLIEGWKQDPWITGGNKGLLDKPKRIGKKPEFEINLGILEPGYMDIVGIRHIEYSEQIKRIIIHEVAHAISDCYKLDQNEEIKQIFKTHKRGFENIDEFLAECYMVSEYTDKISLAKEVRTIVDKIIDNSEKKASE